MNEIERLINNELKSEHESFVGHLRAYATTLGKDDVFPILEALSKDLAKAIEQYVNKSCKRYLEIAATAQKSELSMAKKLDYQKELQGDKRG